MLSKAASLGGDVSGVVIGSDVRALADDAGSSAPHSPRRRRPAARGALPQPRVDVLAQLVRDGASTRSCLRLGARGRRRRRSRGAARRGSQLGPRPTSSATTVGSSASGRRCRTRSMSTWAGPPSRDLHSFARARSIRRRGRQRGGRGRKCSSRSSRRARAWSNRRMRRAKAPRSRTPRSSSPGDAASAVRRTSRSSSSSRRRSAGRSARHAPSSTRAGTRTHAGRPDGENRRAEAVHRLRHLRRDPAQGRHAERGVIVAINKDPTRRSSSSRTRRRRRRARDRAEADRARNSARAREAGRLPAAVPRRGLRRAAE